MLLKKSLLLVPSSLQLVFHYAIAAQALYLARRLLVSLTMRPLIHIDQNAFHA